MTDRSGRRAESVYPEDLKYTSEHEWVRAPGETPETVRVGITHYAQDQLGDIVYVQLPGVGEDVVAGQPCGELESTKSVSDLYAPVTGTVARVNEELSSHPELVNSDPYGAGWLIDITPAEMGEATGLLSAADYQEQISA
ncbi:MAG TPA: glycine cleavage system protein GcvH [Jiangellaceae bacterium]|nr:glycine cleavage system protein GcvH [Jiangellaceae bacterium]